MGTTSLCSSKIAASSFSTSILESSKMRFGCLKRSSSIVFASGRESYGSDNRGRLVDESMIILRKRIHEMKVIDRNYEPPAEWMDWEKQYYGRRDEFICELVGLLQLQLMNTRPSLALGMLMLISMSVPSSAVMMISRLMEAANAVVSTVHLSWFI